MQDEVGLPGAPHPKSTVPDLALSTSSGVNIDP
jgi:hypothetical protein